MSCQRRGVTLIELLVVIAIIAMLVGLVLPAIQAARESARRVQCLNHFRQISLATQSYHDSKQYLPPAAIVDPGHNWPALVLCELDQQNLYDQYRFDRNFNDPSNASVVTKPLEVLHCPSSPAVLTATFDELGGKSFGLCDYWPMTDIDPATLAAGLVTPRGNPWGPMQNNRGVRMSEVHDGTSSTILMVEDAGRPEAWLRRTKADGKTPPAGWAITNFVTPINLDGASSDGLTLPGDCVMNCTNVHEIYSFHPRGACFTMVDGSTRYISEGVSLEIISQLITYSGGEVVSPKSY
jgi:prepilin-type N-terminal cleavage/methylation domain-containing protein